jgi:cell division protease FtsH
MVSKWGLSEKLGPLAYSEEEGEVFLGRSTSKSLMISAPIAQIIDEEIRSVIDKNYDVAKNILQENMDKLHAMADALMKYETIDAGQIDSIMEGKEPGPPSDWTDDSGTPGNPSDGEVVQEKTAKEESKEDTSIGGPAGQH